MSELSNAKTLIDTLIEMKNLKNVVVEVQDVEQWTNIPDTFDFVINVYKNEGCEEYKDFGIMEAVSKTKATKKANAVLKGLKDRITDKSLLEQEIAFTF